MEIPVEMKHFLLMLSGGYGKHIAATAVLRAFRMAHPKANINVLAAYPEIFAGLRETEFANRVFGSGVPVPYFGHDHRNYVKLNGEPYLRPEFERGQEHLIDAWCRCLGVEPPVDRRGFLRVSQTEHETALRLLHQVTRDRPWVAFQPWGGTSYYSPQDGGNLLRPKQARDLSTEAAQGIVDGLVEKGCVVIQISLPTERRLKNVIWLDPGEGKIMEPRVIIAILHLCQYFIGIDSFGQHAWAALRKPDKSSVVLWGGTSPKSFSYPCHLDMALPGACETQHCNRPYYIGDFVGRDTVWRCPAEEACMKFDPAAVVAKLFEHNPEPKKEPKKEEKCPPSKPCQ